MQAKLREGVQLWPDEKSANQGEDGGGEGWAGELRRQSVQSKFTVSFQVSPTLLFYSPTWHREPHQIPLSKLKTLESSTSPLLTGPV